MCREVLRDAIQGKDVSIRITADGVEALGALEAAPYDILITDLNMPRMDGLSLLGHARELHPHILTIIITGFEAWNRPLRPFAAARMTTCKSPSSWKKFPLP